MILLRPKSYTYRPSTDGGLGMDIIESERIQLEAKTGCWGAFYNQFCPSIYSNGKTPLIAAMRCFVRTVAGNEIEIPKELA
jgi:hypothetical protein